MKPLAAEISVVGLSAPQLAAELKKQEAIIREADARIEVDEFAIARALRTIRDQKLYRNEHEDFEDYACEVTGKSARRVLELMVGAEVADRLRERSRQKVAPTRESIVKMLLKSGFSDKEIDAAWDMILAQTKGGQPTEKQVRNAIKVLRATPEPKDPVVDATDAALEQMEEDRERGQEEGEVSPPWSEPEESPSHTPASSPRRTILDCPRVEGPKPQVPTHGVDSPVEYGREGGEDTLEGAVEDWIELLPARSKLSVSCRDLFDAAARAWMDLDETRKVIRSVLAPLHNRKGAKDSWAEDFWKAASLPAPASWRECLSCMTDRIATGINPKTGATCGACEGRGYHQR